MRVLVRSWCPRRLWSAASPFTHRSYNFYRSTVQWRIIFFFVTIAMLKYCYLELMFLIGGTLIHKITTSHFCGV